MTKQKNISMSHFYAQHISYRQTKSFSALVLDYIEQAPELKPFYAFEPTMAGLHEAMSARQDAPVNRTLLQSVLQKQYDALPQQARVQENIRLLADARCFTVCTAHQPNIFTGHLYFIYKIFHAIKLAEELQQEYPDHFFVPVYYMGSEDADIKELGSIQVHGKTYTWRTGQTGAVGRMVVDKELLGIINELDGHLSVEPFGGQVVALMRGFHTIGKTISQATIELLHELFGKYGLIVLQPDERALKAAFVPVMQRELLEGFSQPLVAGTVSRFPEKYKVQASGRDINLFYLADGLRERIVADDDGFAVVNTSLKFSKGQILEELNEQPERFSPNVILRPLYQETILPNIAFIGGGGELAYWMELRKVFQVAGVPMPVMFLRNSFLLLPGQINKLRTKYGISDADLFLPEQVLGTQVVQKLSDMPLTLGQYQEKLLDLYQQMAAQVSGVDPTLSNHTLALHKQAQDKVSRLEKKLIRAARRRQKDAISQIHKIHQSVFPNGTLQERVDNIMPWISRYGFRLMDDILASSNAINPTFTILSEPA
ncbi:MAG TPA: bacillithiol biosynthesis cysteine-adding enzyme BshC [Chitinophagaceae bacterium]|nr:bacillithiol biosynthesis cysteine-adding enzyme BshC [Chitinophagaceae bacterium]